MKEYLVIYEQGEDGTWGAYCPDLPVFAGADTREETAALMREALPDHIDALREAGLEVPEPTHHAEYIAVEALAAPDIEREGSSATAPPR